MLKIVLVVCLGFVLFLEQGDASSTGAPVAACENMTPRHNLKNPQPNPSPFTASVTAAGTNMYNFRLTAAAARPFKGVFVQARDAGGNIVGSFSGNTQVHTIDCLGGIANAATHNDNATKTDVSMVWNSAGVTLPVTMFYTSCQDFDNFWVMESITVQ